MSTPRLVPTAELARVLGLSTRTIQRYRQEKLITPAEVSIGGHARWDVAHVREQIKKLRQQPDD